MKDIYFLSGVFRCGNTLLRSILNQNPNIYLGSNSLTPEIVYRLHLIKDSFAEESNNHKFLENVIKQKKYNYKKIVPREILEKHKEINEMFKKYGT